MESVSQFFLLLLTAFGVSAGLQAGLRYPALQAGLVDVPGGRKHHDGKVPLIGGIGIFLSFMTAVMLCPEGMGEHVPLFVAMAFLLVVGVIDDLLDIQALVKLLAQIFAAVLVTSWGGVTIESLGNPFGTGPIALNDWAIPFTVFALVGLINAINMIDGIDGLAAGLSFVALLLFSAVLAVAGTERAAMLALLMAAAVGGFMLFNLRHPWRSRAAVFLGDAGSMVLGLALGWFAIRAAQEAQGAIAPVGVLWVLALPVIDTLSLMLRRIAKGRSPFYADREHLHHVFKRAGFSDGQSALILVGLSLVLGAVGILASWVGVPQFVLLAGLLVLFGLHFYFISHAWRILRLVRRRRGLG